MIDPIFPLVEQIAIVKAREMVGKSSNVMALLATVSMDVQNFPISEKAIITVL